MKRTVIHSRAMAPMPNHAPLGRDGHKLLGLIFSQWQPRHHPWRGVDPVSSFFGAGVGVSPEQRVDGLLPYTISLMIGR